MTDPFLLDRTLACWNDDGLTKVLNEELRGLPIDALPLQQGLSQSSVALNHRLSATILNTDEGAHEYIIHAGLFYTGIIGGCNCADDPSPQDEVNEYCEVTITIDKVTGKAVARLAG